MSAAKRIRFFGLRESLQIWDRKIRELTGRESSGLKVQRSRLGERLYVVVELTGAERDLIQERLWYAESGTGHTATGRPYRWNDCVTFDELK